MHAHWTSSTRRWVRFAVAAPGRTRAREPAPCRDAGRGTRASVPASRRAAGAGHAARRPPWRSGRRARRSLSPRPTRPRRCRRRTRRPRSRRRPRRPSPRHAWSPLPRCAGKPSPRYAGRRLPHRARGPSPRRRPRGGDSRLSLHLHWRLPGGRRAVARTRRHRAPGRDACCRNDGASPRFRPRGARAAHSLPPPLLHRTTSAALSTDPGPVDPGRAIRSIRPTGRARATKRRSEIHVATGDGRGRTTCVQ